MARPLAILGGTFDPIHNAHLRVAWEAAEMLDADVRLVPANIPPHRAQPIASAAQRLAMLRVALAGQDRLRVDECELQRPGPSFTVDTLTALRQHIGRSRPLVLLVGADAYAGLASWRCWRDLFGLAHIGVLTRPHHVPVLQGDLAMESSARALASVQALQASSCGGVFTIPVTALDISASQVRALLRDGREPRFLVPRMLLQESGLLDVYREANASEHVVAAVPLR